MFALVLALIPMVSAQQAAEPPSPACIGALQLLEQETTSTRARESRNQWERIRTQWLNPAPGAHSRILIHAIGETIALISPQLNQLLAFEHGLARGRITGESTADQLFRSRRLQSWTLQIAQTFNVSPQLILLCDGPHQEHCTMRLGVTQHSRTYRWEIEPGLRMDVSALISRFETFRNNSAENTRSCQVDLENNSPNPVIECAPDYAELATAYNQLSEDFPAFMVRRLPTSHVVPRIRESSFNCANIFYRSVNAWTNVETNARFEVSQCVDEALGYLRALSNRIPHARHLTHPRLLGLRLEVHATDAQQERLDFEMPLGALLDYLEQTPVAEQLDESRLAQLSWSFGYLPRHPEPPTYRDYLRSHIDSRCQNVVPSDIR